MTTLWKKADIIKIILSVMLIFVSGCAQDKNHASFKDVEEKINDINAKYYSLYYAHPHEEDLDIKIKWRAINMAFVEDGDVGKTELVKNLSFRLSWNIRGKKIHVEGRPENLSPVDAKWLEEYLTATSKLLEDYLIELRLYFHPVIVPMKRRAGYKFVKINDGDVVEAYYYPSNRKIVSTFDSDMLLKQQKSYDIKTNNVIAESDVSYIKHNGLFYVDKIVKRIPSIPDKSDFATYEFAYDFSNAYFPLKSVSITANQPKGRARALVNDLMEFSITK